MASKKGLGKGLSALISENVKENASNNTMSDSKEGVITLAINEVEPNRSQPRKAFDEDALAELAESIKQYGILQPLLVQKEEGYYAIIAGERRWRAAKLAGLKEIPVVIKGYTPQEVLEISLIENIQREDLNAIEEAQAYQRLMDEFHLKQDDVAEKVSKSRSAVANALRLLNLDKGVQQMLIDDMISSGHARTLLSLADKELQYKVALKVFDEKLSVRETEKLVKGLLNPQQQNKSKKVEIDPIYQSLENRMKEILGTKVSIVKKSNKKGKIEIEYYSEEELDRLMDLMSQIG